MQDLVLDCVVNKHFIINKIAWRIIFKQTCTCYSFLYNMFGYIQSEISGLFNDFDKISKSSRVHCTDNLISNIKIDQGTLCIVGCIDNPTITLTCILCRHQVVFCTRCVHYNRHLMGRIWSACCSKSSKQNIRSVQDFINHLFYSLS